MLEDNDFDYETLDTDVEYTKAGKHAEDTLHNALEKLFDLSNLTDAQKNILFHLSCMDSQPFTVEAVTNWLYIKTPAIKKLIKLGWIQPSQQTNNTQFYQLHQTITHTVKTVFTKTIPANKRVALMRAVLELMQADYQGQNHDIRYCLPKQYQCIFNRVASIYQR